MSKKTESVASANVQTMVRPGRGPMGRGPAAFGAKPKLKNPKITVKRLLGYLAGKKGVMIAVLVMCAVTTLISVVLTRINASIVDLIVDGVKTATGVDMTTVIRLCLIMLTLVTVSALATFFSNRVMAKIAQTTGAKIRDELFSDLQTLPLNFYDKNPSGDVMSRAINDVDNISMALSQSITQLVSGIISLVGIFVAMVLTSWQLTLIGLVTAPLLFLVMRLLIKVSQPVFLSQQKILGQLNGYGEEVITAQKAVFLFSQEERVKREFASYNNKLTKTAIIAQSVSGFMGPINNFTGNLNYFIVTLIGSILVINGTPGVTVGVIFAFLIYLKQFTQPLNQIFNLVSTLQQSLAGAERVFEIMDEEPEKDREGAVAIGEIDGTVEFDDVRFSYVPEKEILHGVDISAKKGDMIAIVGETGAGKTTIINMLTKFYDIDSGEIRIDGVNIDGYTRKSLRDKISIVLQDTYLFSVSVAENLRYARPDATDEEIVAAAKLANAHQFIMQLEDGYNTVLADNGANVSQGQRQLLAIARAVLAESSILILDEATSSIDTKTERDIQNAMLNLMKGKTTFVIAHRLSTIRNADEIIVLSKGNIVERGRHDELLERGGKYAEMYNSQFTTGSFTAEETK